MLSVKILSFAAKYLGKSRLFDQEFLDGTSPGFIRGINPKSKIENPQAPAFIRGINRKSKI
jgi:hypothetical protein